MPNRIFLIYINTSYRYVSQTPKSLSANTLTLPSHLHRLAVKNDPIFEKYDVVFSSWDKDLGVPTRGINLGLRLERIKQKMQLMVQ